MDKRQINSMTRLFLFRSLLFLGIFFFLFISGILFEQLIFGRITEFNTIESTIYAIGVALFWAIETR